MSQCRVNSDDDGDDDDDGGGDDDGDGGSLWLHNLMCIFLNTRIFSLEVLSTPVRKMRKSHKLRSPFTFWPGFQELGWGQTLLMKEKEQTGL